MMLCVLSYSQFSCLGVHVVGCREEAWLQAMQLALWNALGLWIMSPAALFLHPVLVYDGFMGAMLCFSSWIEVAGTCFEAGLLQLRLLWFPSPRQ